MNITRQGSVYFFLVNVVQQFRKISLLVLLFSFSSAYPQNNLDSLIATWNKLSEDYLKINEIDSACKYGNCVVDLMDQELENREKTISNAELADLQRKKAEALSNLVSAYGNSDQLDLAKECYEEALNIYWEINDSEGIYQLHMRIGRVNDLRSDYQEAIPYYIKARDQAKKNNDQKGLALTYYFLGLNNRYLGNYSEALKNHHADLHIQEEINNKVGIANAYITIAAILRKLKDFDAAIDKLMAAKVLFEDMSDTSGIAMVYNDLGSVFNTIGDTDKSLNNHMEAAKLRELIKEYNGLGASNIYISDIYLQNKNYEKASGYLKDAEKAFQNGSNLQGMMAAQIDMSQVYKAKNDLDNALFWLEIAKHTATEIMNYQGLIEICSYRGEIRLLQKLYTEAIDNFNKALSIAERQNNHQEIDLLNSHLANTYKLIGNYKKAYAHQNISLRYKDSVNANANVATAIQMEMEYNYKKEKIKNELLQDKKDVLSKAALEKQETQKKLFFIGVIMFLMISVGLWSRLRYIRRSSRELKEQKEEAERQRLIAESESERATQSEKVKEQFLANMSHEIRTPMNAIKGMTDIIIRNNHPVSQDKYLNAIKHSSENLLVILNEILDLSKLEAGKIELEKIQFEPAKILQNVKNILRFKAQEKGLKLIVKNSSETPPYVYGDPTRLNQILVNLTSNAVKFTEKGSVIVMVSPKTTDKSKTILEFKVKDTGIGIAKEKLQNIFKAFSQADPDTTRKFGGTGLGLAICKRLVELNNGSIEVESEKGLGSTFYVNIPYEIASGEEINLNKNVTIEVKGLKILLVEDNEFNVMVAKDELQNFIPNVEIDVAENGLIAIDKVKSNNYDLILMDVQMPEMDGYDATRNIRKMENSKSQIPIMAMTANVMKEEVDRCFTAGMNEYISKPFDPEDLLLKINNIIKST